MPVSSLVPSLRASRQTCVSGYDDRQWGAGRLAEGHARCVEAWCARVAVACAAFCTSSSWRRFQCSQPDPLHLVLGEPLRRAVVRLGGTRALACGAKDGGRPEAGSRRPQSPLRPSRHRRRRASRSSALSGHDNLAFLHHRNEGESSWQRYFRFRAREHGGRVAVTPGSWAATPAAIGSFRINAPNR